MKTIWLPSWKTVEAIICVMLWLTLGFVLGYRSGHDKEAAFNRAERKVMASEITMWRDSYKGK